MTVTSDEVERLVHEKVNRIRTENGLQTLSHSGAIRSVSRAHSEDMAARDYFSHQNPEGEGPWDRYEGAVDDSACSAYGENIAMNWVDQYVQSDDGTDRYRTNDQVAQAIVDQWMNSDGHRRNILSDYWSSEGVGVWITDDGQVYATQDFCG
ncbi:CAP domain-containing protein [Halobacteriaceae archaeon GCM10025711]